MMHNKRHWDYKSFMTPQANNSVKSLHTTPSCIRTKRILELLEAIPQFYNSSHTTAVRHNHVHNCIAQSKASRKMAKSAGNVPQLIQMIITSHTHCASLRQHATFRPATTSNLHFNWWPLVC